MLNLLRFFIILIFTLNSNISFAESRLHKILKNVCAVSTNVYNLILYIPHDNFISHILQNIWFLLLSLNQHIFSEYNKLLIDYYS